MKIDVKKTYKTERLIKALERSKPAVKRKMRKALNESLDYAVKRSKTWYFNGLKGHLHRRTGRLQSTVGHTDGKWRGELLEAFFGSGLAGFPSVPYAAVHEFGFFGAQHVKEHIRMHAHTFGYFGPPHPFPVHVSAYTRLMSIRKRQFLWPALDDMIKCHILDKNLDAAVTSVLEGED